MVFWNFLYCCISILILNIRGGWVSIFAGFLFCFLFSQICSMFSQLNLTNILLLTVQHEIFTSFLEVFIGNAPCQASSSLCCGSSSFVAKKFTTVSLWRARWDCSWFPVCRKVKCQRSLGGSGRRKESKYLFFSYNFTKKGVKQETRNK